MTNAAMTPKPDDYTEHFVCDTARILIECFNIKDQGWVWSLREGWESTLQEILESWVWRYVRRVTPNMAEPMFQLLLLEFESLYYSREDK